MVAVAQTFLNALNYTQIVTQNKDFTKVLLITAASSAQLIGGYLFQ